MFRNRLVRAVATAVVLLTPAAGAVVAPAVTTTATAEAATFGTLAQRNAYISCVAPGTEVSYTLRVNLLRYAGRALEGIRAHVPASKVTAVLRTEFHLTATEASRVYWCTVRVWG